MKTGNKFSQFKLPGLVGHQQVTASIPFAMTTVFKKMFYPDKNYFLVVLSKVRLRESFGQTRRW